MPKKKHERYTINTACPQCGCSELNVLSDEEIEERFGDVPNIHMECSECALKYYTPMEEACPEWDKECKMKKMEKEKK
jgi:hypothetical protein